MGKPGLEAGSAAVSDFGASMDFGSSTGLGFVARFLRRRGVGFFSGEGLSPRTLSGAGREAGGSVTALLRGEDSDFVGSELTSTSTEGPLVSEPDEAFASGFELEVGVALGVARAAALSFTAASTLAEAGSFPMRGPSRK